MEFKKLNISDLESIKEMSDMASFIVKEHFDPLIGSKQNDYMINLFQTEDAIAKQLENGYQYYFVKEDNNLGFLAFYPKEGLMYLSKFYLYKTERNKGHAKKMLEFVKKECIKQNLFAIELNVNKDNPACKVYEKLGFKKIRSEKNDIGSGYYMDDYVYRLEF